MGATKAMTLRLPIAQAKELAAVAEIDQIPVSQAVRVAIDAHIESRRRDQEFKSRLKRSLEENKDILERLAR